MNSDCFYIYILHSEEHDKYYVGYTSSYIQRLFRHNNQENFNTYTSKYRPWEFAAVFECGDQEGEAIKTKRFIKRQKSRKLILQLIDPTYIPTGFLAHLVRVPDVRD